MVNNSMEFRRLGSDRLVRSTLISIKKIQRKKIARRALTFNSLEKNSAITAICFEEVILNVPLR